MSLIRINHCIILVIRTGVDKQRSKSVIALNPPKVDIYRSRSESNLSFDQIVFMEEKDFESDSEDEVFDNETDSMGSVTPSSTDRRTQNDGPLSAFNPFSLKPPMPLPRRSRKPKIKIRFNQDAFQLLCCLIIDFILL